MASNVDRVREGLALLSAGLDPFIARVLAEHVPDGYDWTALMATKDEANGISGKTYDRLDAQVQLRAMTERFGSLGYPFSNSLSRAEQSLASELRSVRNGWAHLGSFSTDDAYRALDTMERLLRAAGSNHEANQVRTLRLDVQRAGYERETRRDSRVAATVNVADSDLPAWRSVLAPHEDVREGTFATSEFAADLYRVAHGDPRLEAEYRDAAEFFRRTHLTGGLKDLLLRSARRVRGDGTGDAVINLQDRFGGGKTHSMLAVWHLFDGRPLSVLPQDVQDLLRDVDPTGVSVKRVALVGNEVAPAQPDIKPDGTRVHTLWGELAWQLGGAEGYAMVAESDVAGTNPGAHLRDLLARYSPAVVLIDEWVAYARQLYGQSLPAGSFDTQFSFAQSLTQAAAAVPGTLMLVSIPASTVRLDSSDGENDHDASDLEVGGEYGREALDRLNHVVRRVAYAWEPATPDESFEIVRRRLFDEPGNDQIAQINAIARRFVEFYRQHNTELPTGVTERAYELRIRTAYPIHPELLDRLYSEWSTLERFQRTRGVLRLMSTVVHKLWQREDASALIMPATMPLDAEGARGELVQYVTPRWAEIIEADIDGENSVSRNIDTHRPLLGKRSMALRVSRSLLVASAPTTEAARKGVDRKRIMLGVITPGDVAGNVGSAIDALLNGSSHMFRDGERYWYDTQPSLNRLAAERSRDLAIENVYDEAIRRLRQATRGTSGAFTGVITAPEGSAEVPDGDGTRLVVLPPDYRHNGKGGETSARSFASEIIRNRGGSPRHKLNTIIALAADESRWRDLEATVRQYLAWHSISQDRTLDLTQNNAEQATKRMEETNRVIDDQMQNTWIWALHPEQETADQPVTIAQVKCDGNDPKLAARVSKKLAAVGALRTESGPSAVRVDLKTALRVRWNEGHVSVGELWDWYTRYPYLVRMTERRVLTDRLRDVLFDSAWIDRGFALATGLDRSTGEFEGLAVPLQDHDFPPIEDSTLLVRPELALEQRQRENERAGLLQQQQTDDEHKESSRLKRDDLGDSTEKPVAPPNRRKDVRWTGSFDIDPTGNPEAALRAIAQEVLAALGRAEPDVLEIRIDVTADKADGFDDGTVRTVSENARVLGARRAGFEDA